MLYSTMSRIRRSMRSTKSILIYGRTDVSILLGRHIRGSVKDIQTAAVYGDWFVSTRLSQLGA